MITQETINDLDDLAQEDIAERQYEAMKAADEEGELWQVDDEGHCPPDGFWGDDFPDAPDGPTDDMTDRYWAAVVRGGEEE